MTEYTLGTISDPSGIAEILDRLAGRCEGMHDAHKSEKAKEQLIDEADSLRKMAERLRTIMTFNRAKKLYGRGVGP